MARLSERERWDFWQICEDRYQVVFKIGSPPDLKIQEAKGNAQRQQEFALQKAEANYLESRGMLSPISMDLFVNACRGVVKDDEIISAMLRAGRELQPELVQLRSTTLRETRLIVIWQLSSARSQGLKRSRYVPLDSHRI